MQVSYLSIWIDNKPIVWDFFEVFNVNLDRLDFSLTGLILNKRTQVLTKQLVCANEQQYKKNARMQ